MPWLMMVICECDEFPMLYHLVLPPSQSIIIFTQRNIKFIKNFAHANHKNKCLISCQRIALTLHDYAVRLRCWRKRKDGKNVVDFQLHEYDFFLLYFPWKLYISDMIPHKFYVSLFLRLNSINIIFYYKFTSLLWVMMSTISSIYLSQK